MSDQAKDRHALLLMVIDLIAEEIGEGEPCPVCASVIRKLRMASLHDTEIIVESLRAVYGIV